MNLPNPLFLDTNIYIIGATDPTSPERRILESLGFDDKKEDGAIVIKQLVDKTGEFECLTPFQFVSK